MHSINHTIHEEFYNKILKNKTDTSHSSKSSYSIKINKNNYIKICNKAFITYFTYGK